MKNALIGYTGLVGKNILNCRKDQHFDLYNSKNIQEIERRNYDLTIIAAPSAIKWKANQKPLEDLESILSLLKKLYSFDSKKVILFSTVDVYGNEIGKGLDETAYLDLERHPYGKNRLILENYCKDNFNTTIVRLPALFGKFLKKNIIYDLLNDKMIENISLDTHYQWLDLNEISNVINYCLESDKKIVNYVTEPLSTKTIVENIFPEKLNRCRGTVKAFYDVRTSLLEDRYFHKSDFVFSRLEKFVSMEKNEPKCL